MNSIKSRLVAKKKERIVFNTNVSIICNCLMALGKLAIGVHNISIFLCINAFYDLGMALAKLVALRHYKNNNEKEAYDCYKQVGTILSITALIYILYSIRLFVSNENTSYSMLSGIGIATVTFVQIGLAMHGILTNAKEKDPIMNAIKIINLASSLISLVLTQTALLSFSASDTPSRYNGILGILFGGIVMCIGIYMVMHVNNIRNGKYGNKIIKLFAKLIRKSSLEIEYEVIKYVDTSPSERYLHICLKNEVDNETIKSLTKEKLHIKLIIEDSYR